MKRHQWLALSVLLFVGSPAFAGFSTGYACYLSRVPTSNTSIHGDFGYVRLTVYPTATCSGTAVNVQEFLTTNASTSGMNVSWVYSEQEIASLYEKLADAAANRIKLRFFYEDATLGICGSSCRQGRYVEFGVP